MRAFKTSRALHQRAGDSITIARLERMLKETLDITGKDRMPVTLEDVANVSIEAVDAKAIPGVAMGAADMRGHFHHLEAFGHASLEEGASHFTPDTPQVLMSCSKLVTAVAAMRCVQDGLIALDDNVAIAMPEFKKFKVLKGFSTRGKAILWRPKKKMTLRRLLSHTSGIAYPDAVPLRQYKQSIGQDTRSELVEEYFSIQDKIRRAELSNVVRDEFSSLKIEPLLFEPGQGWVYGPNHDWIGELIGRLSGTRLQDFCQTHIFTPLGMHSTSFQYRENPDLEQRLSNPYARLADGTLESTAAIWGGSKGIDMGASGLVSSASDFLQLLVSLLRNDGRVLQPHIVDQFLSWETDDPSLHQVEVILQGDGDDFFPPDVEVEQGLAGMVTHSEFSRPGRSVGSISWAGATATYWWIDRSKGVCGFFGCPVFTIPTSGAAGALFQLFEEAVYTDLAR